MYLIYEKDKLGRTIFEMIFKNTGSVFAKDGVANMTAYILNKRGTLKDKEKFYSLLEEKAVNLTITSNREFTTISLVFLNEKKNFAIKKLLELLEKPNFTEEALEKSKTELLAKKESLKNNYDYIANQNLFKTIFKDTPLQHPVIGDDIENITLEDIKNHFKTYSKEAVVFINGGEKIDIRPFLDILPTNSLKKDLFFKPKHGNITEKHNVEQSYIYFGSEFNISNDELYLAKTATFILGAGGFGSRMMEEIRVKRGYAYSAYAQNEFQKTYTILKGHLQTKLENTEDAIKIVKELIDDFVKNGVSDEELNQAKKFLIGSEPLRNELLAQRLLRKFKEYYYNLPEGYYDKELQMINSLELKELNDFIKKHDEIKNLSFSIVTNENN